MIPNIGPLEIGVLLVVALVAFGPKRLPELGSSMGKAIRGFGKGIKGEEDGGGPAEIAAAPLSQPQVGRSASPPASIAEDR